MADIQFHGITIDDAELGAWQAMYNSNPTMFPDYKSTATSTNPLSGGNPANLIQNVAAPTVLNGGGDPGGLQQALIGTPSTNNPLVPPGGGNGLLAASLASNPGTTTGTEPAHMSVNPNNPDQVWDVNLHTWIPNPNTAAGKAQTAQPLPTSGGGGTTSGTTQTTTQTSGGTSSGVPSDPNTAAGTRLRMKGPQGNWLFTGDPGQIGQLIQQGYKIINDQGGETGVREYKGGYLINYGGNTWLPVDTALNGRITQEQKAALEAGGYTVPSDLQVIGGTQTTGGGGTTGTGTYGNADPGTVLSGDQDLQSKIATLLQLALNQGAASQKSYTQLLDDLHSNVLFNQQRTQSDIASRDALVSHLLGGSFDNSGNFVQNGQNGLLNGYDSLIGQIGQGFDPETMALLRAQATEGPERDYENQVSALKTSLASRGAYGGGDTPGSLGDIVRGYAPLMSSRDTTRQGLLQSALLANEGQKNTNAGLGLEALGGKSSLLGNLAGIYNPNTSQGLTQSALASALSGINSQQNTAFQGLGAAGNFLTSAIGQYAADKSPGLLNSILSGLIGTTGNFLTSKYGGNNANG